MDVIKNIGRAVGYAAAALGHKHKKTAVLNRIRTVIRCEDRARLEKALELMQACADESFAGLEGDACPCGEDCEEITLEDVACYDEEPGLELEVPAEAEKNEPEESTGLPFEG